MEKTLMNITLNYLLLILKSVSYFNLFLPSVFIAPEIRAEAMSVIFVLSINIINHQYYLLSQTYHMNFLFFRVEIPNLFSQN